VESPAYIARRATIDDLPALQGLWQNAGLPWEELEKFLTEFQVIPGEEGVLLGAIGMLVEGNQALLHSEALRTDDDELRAALWRRIQIVARNQGIFRIWTQEDAPYWSASGFTVATAGDIAASGTTFMDPEARWLIAQLMDPAKAESIVQEQMAVWQASRAQEAEEFQSKVKLFRGFAFGMFAVVIILLLGLLFTASKAGLFNRFVR
jgi:N-acetylglutamate synthase-like GNAT family acetyltransferase